MVAASAPASRRTSLATGLRVAAFVLLLGSAGFWALKGAHRGWSQHQVPVKQLDEITGIEFVTYEDRFVPGLEFLLGGAGLAAGLAAASFFVSRKTIPSQP
jgi:hypothetical protein